MQEHRLISVLILYTHPLLGEGLVGLLGPEPGLDVVAVKVDDVPMVECALAASPQVVIFERGDPDRAVEILELVPDALVIDIGLGPGPTFTYRRDEISALPDAIVAAIRGASARPASPPVVAPAPASTRTPELLARR